MAAKICDREPCNQFKEHVLKAIRVKDDHSMFEVEVIPRDARMKHHFMPLIYCPFCGTKLEAEVVMSEMRRYRA